VRIGRCGGSNGEVDMSDQEAVGMTNEEAEFSDEVTDDDLITEPDDPESYEAYIGDPIDEGEED
jgi:hypothetical protein